MESALTVSGPLTVNDIDLCVTAALEGAGLAYVLENVVEDHIAAGRLVPVLQD
jgi:DNA-binding transcriptional LysR family regulator